VAGTSRPVTFHGRTHVTVATGTEIYSDPIDLSVAHGQDLTVDRHVTGGDAAAITGHDAAQGTQFVADGSHAGGTGTAFTSMVRSWFGSTAWTSGPAAGTSIAGRKRERNDVRRQTAARYLSLADGINGIGYHADAASLINGLAPIARRAHRDGIRVIGATITPYGCDSGCFAPQQEATRQQVNAWIRSTPTFDGVADFDAATRRTRARSYPPTRPTTCTPTSPASAPWPTRSTCPSSSDPHRRAAALVRYEEELEAKVGSMSSRRLRLIHGQRPYPGGRPTLCRRSSERPRRSRTRWA
jgi:hypothetical protein